MSGKARGGWRKDGGARFRSEEGEKKVPTSDSIACMLRRARKREEHTEARPKEGGLTCSCIGFVSDPRKETVCMGEDKGTCHTSSHELQQLALNSQESEKRGGKVRPPFRYSAANGPLKY